MVDRMTIRPNRHRNLVRGRPDPASKQRIFEGKLLDASAQGFRDEAAFPVAQKSIDQINGV